MERPIKILLFLVFIILILLLMINSIKEYSSKNLDITNRIGREIGSTSLTKKEYVLLAEQTIGLYIHYVKENEFEKAYSMCTNEYHNLVSFEDFKEAVSKKDYSSCVVQSIVHRTENMYVATLIIGEEKNQFLIIMSETSFNIVPEPFLKYVEVNKSISKDGVKYELIGYQINVEQCYFDVKITNNKKEDISILSAGMKLSSGYEIMASNPSYIISPGEEKETTFVCNTTLDFPSSFEIIRDDEEKERLYEFKLD